MTKKIHQRTAVMKYFVLLLFVSMAGVLLPTFIGNSFHGNSAVFAQDSPGTGVVEIVLSRGILDREPVGVTNQVSLSDQRIYTWTKIRAEEPPTVVRHVYYHNDKKVGEVVLNIESPMFRTWSYKTLRGTWMLGKWRVEILSAGGELLAGEDFTVIR